MKAPRTFYIAKRGDTIDERLSDYLNKNPIPVRFNRQEEGVYLFGSLRV